jgi:lipopolysaccharide heptosyltransferase II
MQTQHYKKILVLNLGGIGDVLLSTPALRSLKKAFPDASLEVVVVPRVAEIVKGLEYISAVHFLRLGWGCLLRNIVTVWSLRARQFDIAINMLTLNSYASAQKMRLLLALIRPKQCAGRNTAGRGVFFDIKIAESILGDTSVMEYDIALAQAVGAAPGNRTIDFTVDAECANRMKALFAAYRISDSDSVVGIHPGGRPSRRWPVKNFALLMQKLQQASGCTFIITGDTNERPLARALVKALPQAIDLTGALSIKELGACIQRCRLFISNDTGPMHIAAIVKTPQVALFGPGSLAWYSPSHISERAKVIYKKLYCVPCERPHCRHIRCLRRISVDEVLETALGLLRTYTHNA